MPRPLTVLRDLERGEWELIDARPHPALRPHVVRYTGWFERRTTPLQRRELPSHYVPLIINFGAPIRVSRVADPTRWDTFGTFTTGAYDSYVLVETDAGAGGIQVDFALLGARLFLDNALDELTNRAIALDGIFGGGAGALTAALHDAPTWDARFDLLDRAIARRLEASHPVSREMLWTWNRLVDTGGQVSIGSLSAELGWSRRRFAERFREDVGLAPKVFARVLRFHRAVETLKAPDPRRLRDAFGFQPVVEIPGPAETTVHAELRFGDGFVMLATGDEGGAWGDQDQAIAVHVDDPDALFTRATTAGAAVVLPLATTHGARHFWAPDLEGFLWGLSTYRPGRD